MVVKYYFYFYLLRGEALLKNISVLQNTQLSCTHYIVSNTITHDT